MWVFYLHTGRTLPLISCQPMALLIQHALIFKVTFQIKTDSEACTAPKGWSGGAKVLGELPVPGRPTNLDYCRARACCACGRCGWGCLDIFSLIYHFYFLSPSLWETA